MKMRRILAICIMVVFAIGCLVSCGEPTVEELVTQGEQALIDNPYRVAIDMTFTGDETDETVAMVLAMIGGIDISMAVDGENVEMSYGMEMGSGTDVISVDMKMTAIGDTVYVASTQSYGGEGETYKMKATVTDAQREEIFGQFGGDTAEVSPADFETVEMEKADGTYVITCTDLKADSIDKLNGMLGEMGSDESVSVSNPQVVFEVKDGKYQKATITCDYGIEVDVGVSVALSASVVLTYSYENVAVAAPSDAAAYEEIDINDMLQ